MQEKDRQNWGVKLGIHKVSFAVKAERAWDRGGRRSVELYGPSNDLLLET